MTQYELSLENVKKALKHPVRAFDEVVLYYAFRLPVSLLNAFHTVGTNVFDREWDVLVILDTCRVDALRELQDEYEFITEVDSMWSVGGASPEWMARTFDRAHIEEIRKTAYLTANGHVTHALDKEGLANSDKDVIYRLLRLMPSVDIDDIGKVEYVFSYEPPGETGPRGHRDGGTPPRYVTDRGIAVGREDEFERLILHYSQPHSPWVANAIESGRELEPHENDWWGYLTETGDVETVWESYLDELRYVLDDVELLLENVDADTVAISADHGEAFGEYGILGHKNGSLHPQIRRVPWVVTAGEDTRSYSPTVEEPESAGISQGDVDRQLEALGYKM